MTNTTTTNPSNHVRFGIAKADPILETWMERDIDGFGFEMSQNYFPEVEGLSVHDDATATTYLDALLDAVSLIRSHAEIPGIICQVTVSDGTGLNFVSAGWETAESQIDFLLGVVRDI